MSAQSEIKNYIREAFQRFDHEQGQMHAPIKNWQTAIHVSGDTEFDVVVRFRPQNRFCYACVEVEHPELGTWDARLGGAAKRNIGKLYRSRMDDSELK